MNRSGVSLQLQAGFGARRPAEPLPDAKEDQTLGLFLEWASCIICGVLWMVGRVINAPPARRKAMVRRGEIRCAES